jgi:hypothetical protein
MEYSLAESHEARESEGLMFDSYLRNHQLDNS